MLSLGWGILVHAGYVNGYLDHKGDEFKTKQLSWYLSLRLQGLKLDLCQVTSHKTHLIDFPNVGLLLNSF